MGLIVSVDRGTAKPDKRSAIALVADDENPSRYITSVGSDGSRDRIALRDLVAVRSDFDGLDEISAITAAVRDPDLDDAAKLAKIEAVITGRTAAHQEAPA